MESEKQTKTVVGNTTSELTDGKINSVESITEKYMTITKQIFKQISNEQQRNNALEQIRDALITIYNIDQWLFHKSNVEIYSSYDTNYFDIHISLPAGIGITMLKDVISAKYKANIYWAEILSFDLILQFRII